jgi:hypothetical protein
LSGVQSAGFGSGTVRAGPVVTSRCAERRYNLQEEYVKTGLRRLRLETELRGEKLEKPARNFARNEMAVGTNLTVVAERFREAVAQGYLKAILNEIVLQSKVEFNYQDK